MSEAAPVGLAGLGLVGAALAARLLAAGHAVLGWDPDPARRAALRAIGGATADGPAALGQDCEALIVAVYDADQAAALIAALPKPAQVSTILCVTTCDPGQATGLAQQAAALGLGFVEFPLSGNSREIRAGDATGMLGAEDAVARGIAPLLRVLCPRHLRVGGVGDAARMKLAVNLVLQVNRAALAEGMVLAERQGLDPALFLEVARHSAARSAVMDGKGPKMVRGDFAPESRIVQTLKDAELILAAGAEAGQPLPLASAQAALLREAVAEDGSRDSAAVIEAIRALGRK
ncbi:NAD(P)-dependent oxidoreductase [Muricoccus aerilatus]|uniref:NAD(P)-dependent oxidoreductase n=1 Tax=Muricoccus aerilatus TaxID=452982 RepID=UPI0005C21537|nr:NAD(P)-dependent oxidoreductase [Roseomonas aerilata]